MMSKLRQVGRFMPCSHRRIEFLSRSYVPAGWRHFGPSFLGLFTNRPTGRASISSLLYGTSRERNASVEARGSSQTPSRPVPKSRRGEGSYPAWIGVTAVIGDDSLH